MKKTLSFIAIALFAIILFTTGVEATDVIPVVETLQSKIDATADGGTVFVDQNYAENVVVEGKSIYLSLGGHTITNSSEENGHTITVAKDAKLKIYGEGKIVNTIEGEYAAILNNGETEIGSTNNNGVTIEKTNKIYYNIVNHGQMKIWGAIVINKTPYSGNPNDLHASLIENGYYNYTSTNPEKGYVEEINQEKPKLMIYGGEFDGGRNTVKNDDNGELIITGGNFKNNFQVTVFNWNEAIINGGTFNVPTGEDKTTLFNGKLNDNINKGNLTVSAGEFNGEYFVETNASGKDGKVIIDSTNAILNITKGVINLGSTDAPRPDVDLTISGGKFAVRPEDKYLAEDVVCKELNEQYVVGKLYTIEVDDVTGGSVTVSTKSAIVGEIIKLTVEEKPGYKLDRIGMALENAGGPIFEFDSFEMPNGDVTLTPVFVKLEQEAVVPEEVANAEKVEEMLLKELAENEEFAELIKNNNVTIKLEFNKVEEKDIPVEDKKEIETAASEKTEDIKIAKFIDITINVIKDETVVDNVENVKEAITFKVKIPTDLPKVAEGYTRTYYIVRNHNGKIEFLDTKVSGEELEFSSNLFSTYAIAYSDAKVEETKDDTTTKPSEEKDETPNMGSIDTVLYASAIVAIISLAGIVMVKKYTK